MATAASDAAAEAQRWVELSGSALVSACSVERLCRRPQFWPPSRVSLATVRALVHAAQWSARLRALARERLVKAAAGSSYLAALAREAVAADVEPSAALRAALGLSGEVAVVAKAERLLPGGAAHGGAADVASAGAGTAAGWEAALGTGGGREGGVGGGSSGISAVEYAALAAACAVASSAASPTSPLLLSAPRALVHLITDTSAGTSARAFLAAVRALYAVQLAQAALGWRAAALGAGDAPPNPAAAAGRAALSALSLIHI